mmetsp:Transcript_2687/g.7578  ORF Transcript_2687/g.7578 Transcript_2687/m.7578 type:complete len:254 (+) Transcript_2687:528-1289(+)
MRPAGRLTCLAQRQKIPNSEDPEMQLPVLLEMLIRRAAVICRIEPFLGSGHGAALEGQLARGEPPEGVGERRLLGLGPVAAVLQLDLAHDLGQLDVHRVQDGGDLAAGDCALAEPLHHELLQPLDDPPLLVRQLQLSEEVAGDGVPLPRQHCQGLVNLDLGLQDAAAQMHLVRARGAAVATEVPDEMVLAGQVRVDEARQSLEPPQMHGGLPRDVGLPRPGVVEPEGAQEAEGPENLDEVEDVGTEHVFGFRN